ncbi:class I SAM-dependent methyltransferase [Rhodovibrionaceae bacterium A322]
MKDDVASSTAFTVLQGLMVTAEKPDFRHLVSPETLDICKTILQASSEGQRRLRQVNSSSFRVVARLMERLLLPGITAHYALRKSYIREAVKQALADGFDTVVNLGAGFDTLAYELHSLHPGVTFFELDHPATSTHKQEALGAGSGPNLHMLPVDFTRTSADDALRSHPAFAADKPALFICEGVLMYLPLPDVKRLFSGLSDLHPKTRMVFSCVSPFTDPNNNSGPLLRLYLRVKGEPMNWTLPPADLAEFLAGQGYKLMDLAETPALKARFLPDVSPKELHRGEYLALAEVASLQSSEENTRRSD